MEISGKFVHRIVVSDKQYVYIRIRVYYSVCMYTFYMQMPQARYTCIYVYVYKILCCTKYE